MNNFIVASPVNNIRRQRRRDYSQTLNTLYFYVIELYKQKKEPNNFFEL
ncbi:MAG: hypothetical protein ACI9SG_002160 [Maribacter sp.]|jgi:hypothetical protein